MVRLAVVELKDITMLMDSPSPWIGHFTWTSPNTRLGGGRGEGEERKGAAKEQGAPLRFSRVFCATSSDYDAGNWSFIFACIFFVRYMRALIIYLFLLSL